MGFLRAIVATLVLQAHLASLARRSTLGRGPMLKARVSVFDASGQVTNATEPHGDVRRTHNRAHCRTHDLLL